MATTWQASLDPPTTVTVLAEVAGDVARSMGSDAAMRCSSWRWSPPTLPVGIAMGRASVRQVDRP
jgi:hypothetical protein